MTDSAVPVTYDRTSYSAVLASPAVGKGRIEATHIEQTVYPNGLVVTRIHHNEIQVYDNKAQITRHNQPNQVDLMV